MAEIIIAEDQDEAGRLVAAHLAALIRRTPETVLGVATGSTPLSTYRALADEVVRQRLGMDRVQAFALDEYVGLSPNHPESYRSVVTREVTVPLGLNPDRVHVPDGGLEDIGTAGARYEAAINEAGGIDVQILGIGTDGHIGFNEPGSSFASLTRVKTLTEQTRRDNARFFGSHEDVPIHCITQGLGTILRAKHLVLLAFGSRKAAAVAAAVEGPLGANRPATAIQLHPHVTVIVDEAAAEQLRDADYYHHVQANKPDWQGL